MSAGRRHLDADLRRSLARVVGRGRRFVRPAEVAAALEVDSGRLRRSSHSGPIRAGYAEQGGASTSPCRSTPRAPALVRASVGRCSRGVAAVLRHGMDSRKPLEPERAGFRTTVIKTAARVRSSKVVVLDHEYLLRHAPEALFGWGIESEWTRRRACASPIQPARSSTLSTSPGSEAASGTARRSSTSTSPLTTPAP